jgi:hypothetical protein
MPILRIAKRDGRAIGIPVSNLGSSEFRFGEGFSPQIPGDVIVGVAAVYASFSGYQG